MNVRGYGRTTGWDPGHDGDLASWRLFNLLRDVMGLLDALGRTDVALLAGHDFGASVAAWAALIRPDIFHKLALMSAPFPGPPDISPQPPPARSIHAELAALDRPRKHYQWYYSTRQANAEMRDCPQGVHAFLQAYFHHKNAPPTGPVPGWSTVPGTGSSRSSRTPCRPGCWPLRRSTAVRAHAPARGAASVNCSSAMLFGPLLADA